MQNCIMGWQDENEAPCCSTPIPQNEASTLGVTYSGEMVCAEQIILFPSEASLDQIILGILGRVRQIPFPCPGARGIPRP